MRFNIKFLQSPPSRLSKQLLFLLLLIISTFRLSAQEASIDRIYYNGIYYNLNKINKTATVTRKPDFYQGEIKIPSTLNYKGNTYKVTSIGNAAFQFCRTLTSITIPNSVTSIGNGAFYRCDSLVSITIPNSVTSISGSAFSGCKSLTSVTIPNSVTSIEKEAFRDCLRLTSVTIPNSVTSIGPSAFKGCDSLVSITIPNSVTSIGNGAFYLCSSLASVTIPNSVTSIGNFVFSGCKSLTSINIPNSVTSIGNDAFYGCRALKSINIPNSVTSIGNGAFGACWSLTSIDIPDSVSKIGHSAFLGCISLTSINIPKSVTSIDYNAFQACRSLTSVTIPNSVISIGKYAFLSCIALTSVTIPNSVISIGEYAFEDCSSLTSVTIHNSRTSIESNAFKDCPRLKNVFLSEQSKLSKNVFPSDVQITYYVPTPPTPLYKEKKTSPKAPSPTSWDELNAKMLSWDEYYAKNSKEKRTLADIKAIEKLVNSEIAKWQAKDEFETTQEWRERVNETTRKKKADELSNHYLNIYKKESEKIIEEQQKLAQEYEAYKENLLKEYYNEHTIFAKENFKNSYFELKTYDADNGSFMIRSSKYGDILLPVPRDKARSFKENWKSIKKNMEPVFVPNGKEVALNKIIFKFQGNSFVYDSHTEANYSITDIKYNFQPIQIAEISMKDLNITSPEIDSNIKSTLVGKSASDVLAVQNVTPERKSVAATNRSNVDFAIPLNKTNEESTTFAIIIANENYNSVSDVPYASNDGEILGKYLTRTVGLPSDHVKTYKNAGYVDIANALQYIKGLSDAFRKDLNLIFYYAGHGLPDEKTKNPILLPVDCDAAMPQIIPPYELGSLLNFFGELNANSVVVMLDACFSGTERGDGMLMAGRGVRIKSNQSEPTPTGNTVVLSASQGDETAYPFDTEQHGLFTYFLLKKLQETKGDVSLGELSDYITEQVQKQSAKIGKPQTPTVSYSPAFDDSWRNHKLK